VRIPFNYRHFEDDDRPFELKEEGFRRLDQVVDACARAGIWSILDLHALPGYQNQHWHSDNPTHWAHFWQHRHFQDRVVHLWEALAEHYRDNPWVAGYNPINEPGDAVGETIGPFYRRLESAVRAVDPHHVLFLDGNRYSTQFDQLGDPLPNTVYTAHDYALPGFVDGGPYPGESRGQHVDRSVVEQTFLQRTAYMRQTGTPIWVGEFGPVYTGDPERDAIRYRILEDQLELYERYGAGWSIWTYKDVGLHGLVHADPDTRYMQRFGDLIAKKKRLGIDAWGSTHAEIPEVVEPIHDLIAREFPDWRPYPWGARETTDLLVRWLLFAQAMLPEYAERFRGLGDDELDALADSFGLASCVRRTRLCEILASSLGAAAGTTG